MVKRLTSLMAGAVVILAIPALASADPLHGHFSGYADHSGGTPGVYSIGETYTAYATLDNVQPDPWYPWNGTKEYTVVIMTSVTSYDDTSNPPIIDVDFAPASVAIYEDDTTPADYGNVSTFTDGTNILNGTISNMHAQRLNFPGFNYDVTGTLAFTSGNTGELLCNGDLTLNDFIAFSSPPIFPPAGYEEAYNIDWVCEGATSVDPSTWGRMKGLYR